MGTFFAEIDAADSGSGLIEVVRSDDSRPLSALERSSRIVIGTGGHGCACPDPSLFDLLLTEDSAAAPPWVAVAHLDEAIARLDAKTRRNPLASLTLVQVLRATERLDFGNALAIESMAYSMLLGGREFAEWRDATPRRARDDAARDRVLIAYEGENLLIRLARPHARNAFDARMRDALYDALLFAQDESGARAVVLAGDGPDFCAGGDLNEFGTAKDTTIAHAIRMLRSPVRLLHKLSGRVTAKLHGACIGAGIELPAAASRVIAQPDTWFSLPEVGMGLIPGAGGTVTIPRRIGRHRACYVALSGEKLAATEALRWGLIDAIAG